MSNHPLPPARAGAQPQYRGHSLTTGFHPIVAVAHMRAVGAEALLRSLDENGAAVAPLDLFGIASLHGEGRLLDQLSHETHLSAFTDYTDEYHWLFLNCHPETLVPGPDGRSALEAAVTRHGLKHSQIVIEVLEQATFSGDAVTAAIAAHQERGFLVAIDDFGTGWSNFDRVWGIHPDFVKLDRSIVHRAGLSWHDRRVTKMLISMLHQLGVMVIAEGVETPEEALVLMDADVDFVQGFHFGMPTRDWYGAMQASEDSIRALWPQLSDVAMRLGAHEQAQVVAVRAMLTSAARELQRSGSFEDAAKRFLLAPNTLSCILLDARGIQLGPRIGPPPVSNSLKSEKNPLFSSAGANWSRRPYYKDAIKNPGSLSVYGPHCSLTEGGFVFTAAITVDIAGGDTVVFCGNFRLALEEMRVADVVDGVPGKKDKLTLPSS